MKKQDPNEEPFKACGQCKEVCGITRWSETRAKIDKWDRSYIVYVAPFKPDAMIELMFSAVARMPTGQLAAP
jgi:hypothetical protein